MLDVLLHGQEDVAASLDGQGRGADPRRRARRRTPAGAALDGADAVVHLAAIVGDPACGRDPELSNAVNVEGSRGVVADARELGRSSGSCSPPPAPTTGAWPIPPSRSTRPASSRPVSLYAEQKVGIEKALLGRSGARRRSATPDHGGAAGDELCVTCLRFATVYGVGPRMRFDLTVNEFTRDLWAGRKLDVFGELFWRPYVHVHDAARAVALVLGSDRGEGGRGGLQRRALGRELPQARPRGDHHRRLGRGDVEYVRKDEDPRDYKVSFEKISAAARLRAHAPRTRRHRRDRRARSRRSASATRSTAATRTSRCPTTG